MGRLWDGGTDIFLCNKYNLKKITYDLMGRLWDGHGTVTFMSQRVLPLTDHGTAMGRLWDGYGTVMGR